MELMRHDADPKVRQAAALGLGGIGPGAIDTMPALREALKSSDMELRANAAQALGGLGPAAAPDLSDLIGLAERNIALCQAITAKSEPTPDPRNHGPFVYQTGNAEMMVGPAAVRGLGGLGRAAEEAVPVLIRALAPCQSRNDYEQRLIDEFRLEAALALAAMGPEAKPAIPFLIPMLGEQQRLSIDPIRLECTRGELRLKLFSSFMPTITLGQATARSLAAICEPAVPALITYLKDHPPQTKTPYDHAPPVSTALMALGRLETRAQGGRAANHGLSRRLQCARRGDFHPGQDRSFVLLSLAPLEEND